MQNYIYLGLGSYHSNHILFTLLQKIHPDTFFKMFLNENVALLFKPTNIRKMLHCQNINSVNRTLQFFLKPTSGAQAKQHFPVFQRAANKIGNLFNLRQGAVQVLHILSHPYKIQI